VRRCILGIVGIRIHPFLYEKIVHNPGSPCAVHVIIIIADL
jgi:hypothetical protein